MTGVERIHRILERKPVDRIGLFEHFWDDTRRKWEAERHLKPGESYDDHFGFDLSIIYCLNEIADLNFEKQIIEETVETLLYRDGNGAVLRTHKQHTSTPEHVDFSVKNRADWEEKSNRC
ncbi:MAG: hypothetical protein WC959_11790 [Kiritimatiellales bacterium]